MRARLRLPVILLTLLTARPACAADWCTNLLPRFLQRPAANTVNYAKERASIGENTLPYAVFVPPDYDSSKSWPVILYLHGIGERGSDNVRQTTAGIGPSIARHPENFKALVVMPQAPSGAAWADISSFALKALDDTMARYNVDPKKVYLTGSSAGGTGVWKIGAAHPERFAALMPVCAAEVPKAVPALLKVPIWVFHGSLDPANFVSESKNMVAALKKQGSTQVRYTEYTFGLHNVWDRTYSDPEVLKWLLSQSKAP